MNIVQCYVDLLCVASDSMVTFLKNAATLSIVVEKLGSSGASLETACDS